MLPVLPTRTTSELDELSVNVIAASASLGKGIHPLILEAIAGFMVKVNSYYTNAMEGNPSKLKDIEDALNKKLSADQKTRNYQLEHVAHIQVQEAMIKRLREEAKLRICSENFLCWIHEQFFEKLPEELRFATITSGTRVPVEPGQLRDRGISVGQHEAPETKVQIKNCLFIFEELLSPEKLIGHQKLLGMASSHHRFLWIHPFSEGNGRVARLFTTAYGLRIGVGESMLWTVTRAFARKREEYDRHLFLADQSRRSDLDGRGPLSEENLIKFCTFFLKCCEDQIHYMGNLLKLEELKRRFTRHIDSLVKEKQLSKAGAKVMERLLLQGEVRRSEVLEICRVKQRRSSEIIKELLKSKIVQSETSYGSLRLNIITDMAIVLFPLLA
ncbi:MAG: Fic family protein [Nitrospiria bacterium]